MTSNNPRQANGHRRRQLAARIKAEEHDCWLCGQPVDKTLHHLDPYAAEIDEIIPVSLGGDPLDRRNCRLSHRPDLQPTTRQRHQEHAP